MDRKKNGSRFSWLFQANVWENLGMVILAFYPLRHIGRGLDLWDTGYNYANFQYMGTEHMDPMWFFSTYLANVAGNLLTKLPNGDTLIGMNLYTGLFVSILALTGYFFCTRKLKIPRVPAFAGEMTAVSLCWCPTALLYNYLTYVLFLLASILLFLGLTKDKKGYLAGAGVLLGANVLTRFSNLPEAAMILAVWAYDFLLWRDERKAGQKGEFWSRTARHTLWCLAGYLGALAVLLNYIHICYGLSNYTEGIKRLFAMTEKAADYKPTAMIMGIVGTYVENLYWVIRIGIIILGGMAVFAVSDAMERLCGYLADVSRRKGGKERQESLWNCFAAVIHFGVRILWCLAGAAMLVWLYKREFCSFLFYSYDSVLRPGILFLMLTMLIAAVRIFCGRREEQLISGMLILIVLLTSLGSNNGVYPSLNNLFLAAPYTFWQSWRFVRCVGDKRLGSGSGRLGGRKAGILMSSRQNEDRSALQKKGLLLSGFPAKGILTAFLAMCLFQFSGFGAVFVFAEATGVQEADAYVENNAVLRNIKMSTQKAGWLEELSAFVEENGLEGREVILYGNIPSLSYYLQMPSAFNPWSDLDSYGLEVMKRDLAELTEEIHMLRGEAPVVIVENSYVLQKEEAEMREADGEQEMTSWKADPKWDLLADFMEEMGYGQTFRNDKFTIYQASCSRMQ